jgi:hypothetical protein
MTRATLVYSVSKSSSEMIVYGQSVPAGTCVSQPMFVRACSPGHLGLTSTGGEEDSGEVGTAWAGAGVVGVVWSAIGGEVWRG